MIIKTEEFVLKVSHRNDVYFESLTSGQIFKSWKDTVYPNFINTNCLMNIDSEIDDRHGKP